MWRLLIKVMELLDVASIDQGVGATGDSALTTRTASDQEGSLHATCTAGALRQPGNHSGISPGEVVDEIRRWEPQPSSVTRTRHCSQREGTGPDLRSAPAAAHPTQCGVGWAPLRSGCGLQPATQLLFLKTKTRSCTLDRTRRAPPYWLTGDTRGANHCASACDQRD
jgi:hypothetical protein